MESEDPRSDSADSGDDAGSDEGGRGDWGNSDSTDPSLALREQLAEVPLEDLQRLRSNGHAGRPVSSGRAFPLLRGSRQEAAQGGADGRGSELTRANKNRPMEMSSKRPVPRFREVILAPKAVVRDPRFDSLSGDYDESRFKKSYRFLYEEQLPKEAEKLRKMVKKEKDKGRKGELQQSLRAIEGQLKEEASRRKREEREALRKQEQKEMAKAGKQPYFLSNAKRKRLELVERFKELKAQGKLEAFLAKKRRKNAAKEHTKIPVQRRQIRVE